MKFLAHVIKAAFVSAMLLAISPLFVSSVFAATDTDSDGVSDGNDNCILSPNPLQRDTDSDGYGNYCDADFNNDLIVSGLDVGYFKSRYGTNDPDADLNGDGIVSGLDIGYFKSRYGQSPGPSYIDQPAQASRYEPLAVGNVWQNLVTLRETGQPDQIEYTYSAISKTTMFNGHAVFDMKNDLLLAEMENENMFYSDEAGGIYLYGMFDENSDGQGYSQKVTFDTPIVLLKSAFVFGDSWSTVSDLIIEEDGVVVGLVPSTTWTVSVVAVEDVSVPAGTFQDCYKIVLEENIGGAVSTETFWLAENVGIVKQEDTDGTMTSELQYASLGGMEYGTEMIHQLDNASLDDTYIASGQSLELTPTTTETWSWVNSITFDGAGNCSFIGQVEKGVRRTDDVLPYSLETFTGTPDNGVCTYTLAANGELTINMSFDNLVVEGQFYSVNPDAGTITGAMVLSGTDTVIAAVETLVRQSSGLNNASLKGTFLQNAQSTDLYQDPGESERTDVWSWASGVTFDGAGNCSFIGALEQGIIRHEDVELWTVEAFTGTPDNGTCAYSLGSNGALSINGDPSYVYSPDQGAIAGINFFSGADVVTAIEAMVEQSSTLDDSSISGTYLLTGRSTELTPTTTEAWVWTGIVTFDGAGSCDYTGTLQKGIVRHEDVALRSLEVVDSTPDSATCTYSLASDGTLTIDGLASYAVSQSTGSIVGLNFFTNPGRVASIVERMVRASD